MSVMEVMRVPTVLPEITAQEAMTLPGDGSSSDDSSGDNSSDDGSYDDSSGDGSDYADEDSGDGYDTGY